MKKSLIIALAVMAGAVFNTAEAAGKKKKKECFETVEFNMSADSLNNSMPKVDLKNAVDTVSYAIGMSQTQGMKEYLMKNLGVDTTYLDEFYKGIIVGVDAGDDKKKTAYYAGIQIGQQISNQMLKGINHELFGNDSTKTISLNNFIAAFISGISGKGGLMTIEQAQNMVMTVEQAQNVLQVKIPAIKAKAMEAQYGENKKAGNTWPSMPRRLVSRNWQTVCSTALSRKVREKFLIIIHVSAYITKVKLLTVRFSIALIRLMNLLFFVSIR